MPSFGEDGTLLFSETIKYKGKKTQEERLNNIANILFEVMHKNEIKHVVVERQFVDIMAQIVGVVRAATYDKDSKTTTYVPSKWRKLLTGKGNAKEDEIKEVVFNAYPEMRRQNSSRN